MSASASVRCSALSVRQRGQCECVSAFYMTHTHDALNGVSQCVAS